MYLLGDLITRIKNANIAKKSTLEVPFSNLNKNSLEVLKASGYIVDYKVFKDKNIKKISVTLDDNNSQIQDIKIISKPGRRMYATLSDLLDDKKSLGMVVVSTPKGLLNKQQAVKQGVGGELLFRVW